MGKIVIAIIFVVACLADPLPVFADKVGGGDLTFTPKDASPVVFSHSVHVTEKGLKCTGCHYHIFQMAQGSSKMEMNKIKKGDFCGKCHNEQKCFDVNDTKNCSRCHKKPA